MRLFNREIDFSIINPFKSKAAPEIILHEDVRRHARIEAAAKKIEEAMRKKLTESLPPMSEAALAVAEGVDRSTSVLTRYMFVVHAKGDTSEWRGVRIGGRDCDTSYVGMGHTFPSVTPEMAELWRRVSVDRSVPWDCNYTEPESMRLVRIDMVLSDVTGACANDQDEFDALKRRQAALKLTADDARLLGIEKDYALAQMMKCDKDEASNKALLSSVLTEAERRQSIFPLQFLVDQPIGQEDSD